MSLGLGTGVMDFAPQIDRQARHHWKPRPTPMVALPTICGLHEDSNLLECSPNPYLIDVISGSQTTSSIAITVYQTSKISPNHHHNTHTPQRDLLPKHSASKPNRETR
jgi:hypothetical protein